MAKDSWLKNTELGYINNMDSCQLVCSTDKFDSIKKIEKEEETNKTEPTKLISADEIAASYISNQKNSTVLSKSHLINKSPLVSELGHYAFAKDQKKKTVSVYHKAVFEDNKDPNHVDTILSVAEEIGMDKDKLRKQFTKDGK